ncbi:MAG: hypothetical protein WCC06_05495 [Candidatus Aminicenantales bacterium]
MKKFAAIGTVFLLILVLCSACAKKSAIPKAGSAEASDMLTLLPQNASGIIVIDLHRAFTTEFADNLIKDSKDYQKYQEFVKKTGLDPQKDIYFLALAITSMADQNVRSGVGVINLKYNKETLMAKIKEQGQELKEETYNGISLISGSEDDGKSFFGAFLDESNIALGEEKGVKAVIDIYQKKAKSVLENEELMALIKMLPQNSLVWSAFIFSPEMTQQITAQNPMLSSLESLKSIVVYFDYMDKNILAEIKAMSGDVEKNKQIADLLNGLKALGGMAAATKPEVGELMNKIEITAGPDFVKVYANVPEALLKKLGETAKKKVEAQIEEKTEEGAVEKKD